MEGLCPPDPSSSLEALSAREHMVRGSSTRSKGDTLPLLLLELGQIPAPLQLSFFNCEIQEG